MPMFSHPNAKPDWSYVTACPSADVCSVPAGYLCDDEGSDTATCTAATCAPGNTGDPGAATCPSDGADWEFADTCEGETD